MIMAPSGHDHFCPNPFQFITLSYQLTLYNLVNPLPPNTQIQMVTMLPIITVNIVIHFETNKFGVFFEDL